MKRWRAVGRAVATWYQEWSPWLALIFGGMVVGFLAAKLSTGARAFLSDSITTQWAAAVATVGAAIVALAIASGEARRNHRREVLAGELAAGSIRNYVGSLRVMATSIALNISEAKSAEDPQELSAHPNAALAAHVKNDIEFLRHSLEKIPSATIQPYDPRITANVIHMIDQLHMAEVAAPFPGGEHAVRIALTTVETCCLSVEELVAPARHSAINKHLSS